MSDASSKSTINAGSQTVARAMALVRHVAASGREGMRLQDLVEASGLTRPTAHRLLGELLACQLLIRSPGRRYLLGPFAYEIGLSAAQHFHFPRGFYAPFVQRIADDTGDTVFLVARSGNDSFCLDRRSGSFPVKVFTVEVGHRQPLGVGAGGLALLAWLPERERNKVLLANAPSLPRYGGLTATTLAELIAQARTSGHSRISDFAVPGVTGVGVPVLDAVGSPQVAISVTSVSLRMSAAHEAQVLEILHREVTKLKQALGAQPGSERPVSPTRGG